MIAASSTYQILRDNVKRIQNILEYNKGCKITDIARNVCNLFGIFDGKGKPRISSCINALKKISFYFEGVVLPKSTRTHREMPHPKILPESPQLPVYIPSKVEDLRELSVDRVQTDDETLLWNTVMSDHPKGISNFIPPRVNYLINSEYGCLGGLVFSSAFMNVLPRDRWIGWSRDEKRANLQYVIGMNRFLIRPGINCQGLAVTALQLALDKVSRDFQELHYPQPLLIEAFVDPKFYSGACFEKAGFKYLGLTEGKGYWGGNKSVETSPKKVFVFQLCENFQKQIGVKISCDEEILGVRESLEGDWIRREFNNPALGSRLSESLISLAEIKNRDLGAPISNVSQGDRAKIKRAYFLLNYKDKNKINFETILQTHIENTVKRIRGCNKVYIIQDGCIFNYNSLIHTVGLGPIGKKSGGSGSMGLHEHASFAIREDGLPLGYIFASCFAPELRSEKEKLWREKLTQEEKRTQLWLDHYLAISNLARRVPRTKIVVLCDRECDFFNFYKLAQTLKEKSPNLDYLVRLKHNRPTIDKKNILTDIDIVDSKESISLSIGATSSRTRGEPGRTARIAEMEIRAVTYQIKEPSNTKGKSIISLNVMSIKEKSPPDGEKALCWKLATLLPIKTTEERQEIARLYANRWSIEEQHKVIKSSGTKAEEIRHKDADAIRNEMAIDLILSWNHHLFFKYVRKEPDSSPDGIFSNDEQHVLRSFAESRNYKQPKTVKDYAILTGIIGGFIVGSYEYPGAEILANGRRKLYERTTAYILEKKSFINKNLEQCRKIVDNVVDKCRDIVNKKINAGGEIIDSVVTGISELKNKLINFFQ